MNLHSRIGPTAISDNTNSMPGSIQPADFATHRRTVAKCTCNTELGDYGLTTWNQMAFPRHVFPDQVGL